MVEHRQAASSLPGSGLHPLLFLDIDGVMNTVGGMSLHKSKSVFTPASVIALRRIMQATACRVVISSSWRMDQMSLLETVFADHGLHMILERIIGSTPVLDPRDAPTREDEIGCWLHGSPYRGRMAILDDEPCLGELSPWHVRIPNDAGLDEFSALEAVKLLTEGMPFVSRRREPCSGF